MVNLSTVNTIDYTTEGSYHPRWTRALLLLFPLFEALAILFFFSDNRADRVRLLTFLLLIVIGIFCFNGPILEPMLPAQRRSAQTELTPARLVDQSPGKGYEQVYQEVVKSEIYVLRNTRRVRPVAQGGWYGIHD